MIKEDERAGNWKERRRRRKKNACRLLMRKPEVQIILGRRRCWQEDDIKMDLRQDVIV
jgi:hypothetical protein